MNEHVYAIADASRGLVKIGLSRCPKVRLQALLAAAAHLGYEPVFELLGSVPIPLPYFERLIHRALSDSRHRNEWFVRSPDVEDFLAKVIVVRTSGHGHYHYMRPETWLYRRGMLPERWKPAGGKSNGEIAYERKVQDSYAREAAALRELNPEIVEAGR